MCGRDEIMNALLITAAGASSRFSESLGRSCLKCLYFENSYKESLLYRMISHPVHFDYYIIVGGFQYERLEQFVEQHFEKIRDRIILLENKDFARYGSGYSLFTGLERAIQLKCDEVLFAEGDLFVDRAGFEQVYRAKRNVITYNKESILASKAVAFYYDVHYGIHYIYDTDHQSLEIREPFLGIFNSGQIWKFYQKERLMDVFDSMGKSDWSGTNLTFIQKYFEGLSDTEYEMVLFDTWINCNTVSDFRQMSE